MSEEQFKWCIETGDINGFKDALKNVKCLLSNFLQVKDLNKGLGNGRRPIHIAADFGHLQILELLVKEGADVNVKDNFGITPLLAAVYEEHADCVEFLLKNKAEIIDSPSGLKMCECTDSEDIKRLLQQ
ncbi:Myotrophin [Echinococcus granulosus]|uniref:Myotrophin n=1 Tax=Echinococcus granulosus TaxID=6210 RepID=A0A068WIV0_ECHGR|nr:Myotrophin [Echinococcus granulosus]CDS17544.1 myotrophin [Echinococcus granulosus]